MVLVIKGKGRHISDPKKILKNIQGQLLKLLSRIETPTYLFSGKKRKCSIDNAKDHIPCRYMTTLDIKDFYPNCSREHVYRFFRYKLKMSDDVAWTLTDLTTFKGSLPVGSPCSQLLAYWAYRDMFDEIFLYLQEHGCRLSLFVDDISISCNNPIPKKIDLNISKILKKYKHLLKDKKTKRFYPSTPKEITGCVISPDNKLRVPNRKRKDIINKIQELKSINVSELSERIPSIKGKILAAQQIEPDIFNNTLSEVKGKVGLNK